MNFKFLSNRKKKAKKAVLEKLAFDPEKYRHQELLTFIRQGKYHNILKDHKDEDIRKEVALRAEPEIAALLLSELGDSEYYKILDKGEKAHLDAAITHKDKYIRRKIPQHGFEDHLDILVNDPDDDVRAEVAKYGLKRHLDILLSDNSGYVRKHLIKRGFKDHLEVLQYDTATYYHNDTIGERAQEEIKKRTKEKNFASEDKYVNLWRSINPDNRRAIIWIPIALTIALSAFLIFAYFR